MKKGLVVALTGALQLLFLTPAEVFPIDAGSLRQRVVVPAVSVQKADPSSVQITPGASAKTIILSGEGLEGSLSVKVLKGKRTVRTVTASLGKPRRDGGRALLVGALPNAESGEYSLRLVSSGKEIPVPLKVTVVKAFVKVGRGSVAKKKAPGAGMAPAGQPAPATKAGRNAAKPPPGKGSLLKRQKRTAASGQESTPSPGAVLPKPEKLEIISRGGKKKPYLPDAQSGIGSETLALGSAAAQVQPKDLRCSISASYDEGNTQPIESMGPYEGTWHKSQAPYPFLQWTHAQVIFAGFKPDTPSRTPRRMVAFRVLVRFKYMKRKSTGFGSTLVWTTKEFEYNSSIEPGESYEYRFHFNGASYEYMTNAPKFVTLMVDTTDVVEEEAGNNICQYTIRYESP